MKPSDIQIGTTYRIRQWEDMAAEHGVTCHGGIYPTGEETGFPAQMDHLCGNSYRPESVDQCGDCLPSCNGWTIAAWMLGPLTETPPAPSPTLRIGSFTIRRHDAKSLWIATEDGEGGQFSDEVVEEALREMYRKHNQGGFK